MSISKQFAMLSTILLVVTLWASPPAEAQRSRGAPNAGRAIRSMGGIGKVPNVRLPQALGYLGNAGRNQSSPFPLLDAISRAGSGSRSPFPVLDAISRANGGNNYSSSPFPILEAIARGENGNNNHNSDALNILNGLSQLGGYGGGYPGNGYGGYGNPDAYYGYKGNKEYADAMRDSAIAGAVSNVVSAIVTSQSVRTQPPAYVQSAPVYAQPAPVYAQPAPVYVQPSPLGRYETRREQVGGGYYEREQIWVPESRDPQSGNIFEGHYANVKRWVPEVIQETRVWVAP